ncbi:MAG: hypothetical protein J6C85_05110 [Alphaproteobacteria bacterium]|nr:hypothetical protein [Alphaproteobacteria bacterium]
MKKLGDKILIGFCISALVVAAPALILAGLCIKGLEKLGVDNSPAPPKEDWQRLLDDPFPY